MATYGRIINKLLYVTAAVTKWPPNATKSFQSDCSINWFSGLAQQALWFVSSLSFSPYSQATKRQRMQRLILWKYDCMCVITVGYQCGGMWCVCSGISAFRTTYQRCFIPGLALHEFRLCAYPRPMLANSKSGILSRWDLKPFVFLRIVKLLGSILGRT
jgi:hypothetical protein